MFQVREKSGNFIFSQGNLEKMKKVMEKSGNFKNFKIIASKLASGFPLISSNIREGMFPNINCKQFMFRNIPFLIFMV